MAESILFNIAANILTKLGSPAVKELGLLWGVKDELQKLEHTLSAIKAVLVDAEERLSRSHAIEDWVSKLKDVLYEIEDLMDECAYDALRRQVLAKDKRKRKQVRILFSKFKRPYSNLKLAHKIKDIRKRLQAINEDKTQFSFSESVLDTSVSNEFKKKRETYSFILDEEVVGRNDDKDQIIHFLLDTNTQEHIGIASIVGMGGLGKTTIAQSVYNNHQVTKHFDLKLWICISENFDVKIIGEKIIEAVTKTSSKSFMSLDTLASELRKQIDEKKYLLVMDDLWNEDYEKWTSLKKLLIGGAKGSRILITTRDKKVATTHDTTFFHSLENLNECYSWLLFKKMTFLEEHGDQEFENSNLIEIGKEIVAKLRGVPLAIRTIGRLLKEKKSQNFWLSFKDKELCQVMEQVRKDDLKYMLSILELSYKHLPSNLKQCFLYCALFPKDYRIKKEELILLWKAQGFIPPNDKDEFTDVGEDYFLELLSKSFFQEVRKDEIGNIETCKMHDLMHDLACSIAKSEWIHGLKNVDIDKRTRHFSLYSLDEIKEQTKTLLKAKSLRTLLMLDSIYFLECELLLGKFFHDYSRLRTLQLNNLGVNTKIILSSIGRLKHLRYLSLKSLDIQYLPNSFTELYNLETLSLENCEKLQKLPCDIKNLINLKHLSLIGNSSLKSLPDSIIQLCKLEALDLAFCENLRELPRDIKTLVNLKHLNLSYCLKINHVPKGLGELTNLQTLNEFVLGENNGGGLSELNGLNKLNGHLEIRDLQFCSDVDLQMKAMFLQQKSGLRQLDLEWDDSSKPTIDVYERTLDCLKPHSNLQEIFIDGYGGVKLCNWLSSNSLGRLVAISLCNCERLECLPQFDQFPNLKTLYLRDLSNIEYIDNNDYVCSSTLFPCLEDLRIEEMPKLKRWWKGTISTESTKPMKGSFSIIFPCLSSLNISGFPIHIMMSWHAPLLKSFIIFESKEGHSIEEDELDLVPWQNFKNLSSLQLMELSKLEYLPKCLQHVTTLKKLMLSRCENLKSLPEWIENFTSLTELDIYDCKKLTPEGIQHIHGLQSLRICGCPILKERCKKNTGEDWPKIAHIRNVHIQEKWNGIPRF